MTDSDRYRVDLEQLDDAVAKMATFGHRVEDWLVEVDRHTTEHRLIDLR
ncbi:hypothetical protein [Nocardia sp. R7R-8]